MPIDPGVQSAIDTAAAKTAGVVGAAFEQLTLITAQHAESDGRLMSGVLQKGLFAEDVMAEKTAYNTPVGPATPDASPAAGK